MKTRTLDEILLANGSDKSSKWHNYSRVYERYFEPLRYKPLEVLEWGVDKGASIRTWLEYFPMATVVGCDFVDCPPIDDPRYTFVRATITDGVAWERLPSFDIIIDDNGHAGHEAIFAIKVGLTHLKRGGLFIVEDLHTCYDPNFTPGGTVNPLDFLRGLLDPLNDYGRDQCGDNRKDKTWIDFIHFWKSLVIIGRK